MKNTDTTQRGQGLPAEHGSAAPSHARLQDDLDWKVFAEKFEKRNGVAPDRKNDLHSEYFHWFMVGAHAEFMGRLNVQPNTEGLASTAGNEKPKL